nr:HIT family protein [uncultured bacterium]
MPREEVDHWLDCPADLRDHMMAVAAEIGHALQDVYEPAKVGLMIAGLEVPHLHIHLLPIDDVHDMDFSNARPAERDDLESEAARIREALTKRGAKGVSA